jgi:hypothetical protein
MIDIFDSTLQFVLFSFLCVTMVFDLRPALQVLAAFLLTLLALSNLLWPIRIFVPSAIGDPANDVLRAGTIVVILIYFVILWRRRKTA